MECSSGDWREEEAEAEAGRCRTMKYSSGVERESGEKRTGSRRASPSRLARVEGEEEEKEEEEEEGE